MSVKIINTSLDPRKAFLHRRASKMQMEPLVAGTRLKLRETREITDEQYEHTKHDLMRLQADGIIDIIHQGKVEFPKDTGEKKDQQPPPPAPPAPSGQDQQQETPSPPPPEAQTTQPPAPAPEQAPPALQEQPKSKKKGWT